jgi:L-alanine-DL-glutamate epimerase-like enolase superfamily enzyme
VRVLRAAERVFPLAGEFKISRGSRTESRVVEVMLETDGFTARGEAFPYPRYGESIESVIAQIASIAGTVADGASRTELLSLLPAGAARNAVDCALWDLEAKLAGKRVWELAGMAAPPVLTTAYTLSLDAPEIMGAAALAQAARPVLKLKLGGDGQDVARVAAVRAASPDAMLIVDANEGAKPGEVEALCYALAALGVAMIEQPVAVGDDACLADFEHPVPLCADESFHALDDFDKVAGKYEFINIKLDKTGGLTEALLVATEAKRRGFRIMTGCMVGSSLAMAPAMLPAALSEVVDIDGPLLMAKDRENGLVYRGSLVEPPSVALWG